MHMDAITQADFPFITFVDISSQFQRGYRVILRCFHLGRWVIHQTNRGIGLCLGYGECVTVIRAIASTFNHYIWNIAVHGVCICHAVANVGIKQFVEIITVVDVLTRTQCILCFCNWFRSEYKPTGRMAFE